MNVSAGIVAVVLAGGRATRMGGGDKGLLPLGGRPMLSRVLDCVRPQVAAVALNANGDPARFAAFGLPVLQDAPATLGAGPLAGVLAGLRWAQAAHPTATLLLSVPTDTPLLPPDLVARLDAARAAAGAPVACAASRGRRHPVVALWPVALAGPLAEALAGGERGVMRFAEARGLAVADFAAEAFDPFANVNDPAALAEAEAALREAATTGAGRAIESPGDCDEAARDA
jgi:molybdopterin-guanine dinucleotide biosynthesis protein A